MVLVVAAVSFTILLFAVGDWGSRKYSDGWRWGRELRQPRRMRI